MKTKSISTRCGKNWKKIILKYLLILLNYFFNLNVGALSSRILLFSSKYIKSYLLFNFIHPYPLWYVNKDFTKNLS
jgi:hypothetical protein